MRTADKVVSLSPKGHTRLYRAWKRFVDSGEIDPTIIRLEVAESWRRSRSYGVDPFQWAIPPRLSQEEQQARRGASAALIAAAEPILRVLVETVASPEIAMILSDSEGLILRVIGRGRLGEEMEAGNFREGESLREEDAGTTSAAIVAHTDKPVQISGEEHYCRICHAVTCASAPIHGPSGKMIGILSVTARREAIQNHPHTLGMALAAAGAIGQTLRLVLNVT